MRQCKKCGEEKPLDNFPIADRRGFRRRVCKVCHNAVHRGYYAAKTVEYRDRGKRTYVNWRQKVLEHYGAFCNCCGESEPKFLAVDHVGNDGSSQRRKHGKGRTFYMWLCDNGFPGGFQILCHNCNMGKHLNGGTCPHQEGSTTIAQASRAGIEASPKPPALH